MFDSISFSRSFLRFAVIPLLFIAGFQLYVLSEKTDYYFAWTIALPLTAAFMGAGYWAAMIVASMSISRPLAVSLRTVGLTAIAATGILGIATFLHLDKFHLGAPALFTRFVTWVWIIVYVITPFIFLWLWIAYRGGADDTIGAKPFPQWVRLGYLLQGVLAVLAGIFLFFMPASIIPLWPWALTPLTARAISAWFVSYGLACIGISRENNTFNTQGARISLLAFCVLEFIALARYASDFDWSKPLAWVYLLVLAVGVVSSVPGLLLNPSK